MPVVLGGDHSIVLGELRAHAERHGPLGLVLLDAHADTWDSYYGERYFHGTPFRRALEEGLIAPERSLLAGMRGPLYAAPTSTSRALGVRDRLCEELRTWTPPQYGERVRERLAGGPAFLSFDIDVLDPAFAPGTGTPEIAGLLPHEAVALLRSLAGVEFTGYDVVEVSPQLRRAGAGDGAERGVDRIRAARAQRGGQGDERGAVMRQPGQAPPITEVETHGIETIPAEDRTASPFDLFRVAFGGANTFATVVLGAFPILIFGLSFWQGFLATVAGIVIGGLILMPMALFGPVNGTNNAVSSGAHFGVMGRIVGSFLSLLTAITFFAISVYTSGDILVGALDELAGTGQPEWMLAIAYGFFAVVVLAICLYGFQFMLAVNKVAVVTATLLYLVGAIAYAPDFDAGYAGTVGTDAAALVPAFIGGALLVMANPLSFGAFLGDWARYIPASASRRHLMLAAFCSQAATIVPFTFGLATASIIAVQAPDAAAVANYAGGLVEVTPGWFLLPVCAIAVIGGLSTGTTSLYGTGLDFSSVFPVLSRFQSTILIGTLSIGIIFLGRFALDFVQTIVTFATLIIVCTTPWVVIMTIGFLVRRGWYDPDALQVFNRGQRGGRYWFTRGVNYRGMAAWIPAAVIGLLFVNIPGQFEGPLRNVAEDARPQQARRGRHLAAGGDRACRRAVRAVPPARTRVAQRVRPGRPTDRPHHHRRATPDRRPRHVRGSDPLTAPEGKGVRPP